MAVRQESIAETLVSPNVIFGCRRSVEHWAGSDVDRAFSNEQILATLNCSVDQFNPPSGVSHAVCTLSKTALARRYLAMMSSALAVHTKGFGFLL